MVQAMSHAAKPRNTRQAHQAGPAQLVRPGVERRLAEAIKAIDTVLASGFLTPKAQTALVKERARLHKIQIAGAQGPGGPEELMRPEQRKKVQARIDEIDKLFRTALLSPQMQKKLEDERDRLQKLLLAA